MAITNICPENSKEPTYLESLNKRNKESIHSLFHPMYLAQKNAVGIRKLFGEVSEETRSLDCLIREIKTLHEENHGLDFQILPHSLKAPGISLFEPQHYDPNASVLYLEDLDKFPENTQKAAKSNPLFITSGEIKYANGGPRVIFAPANDMTKCLKTLSDFGVKEELLGFLLDDLFVGVNFDIIEAYAGDLGKQYVQFWKLMNLDNERISEEERTGLLNDLVSKGIISKESVEGVQKIRPGLHHASLDDILKEEYGDAYNSVEEEHYLMFADYRNSHKRGRQRREDVSLKDVRLAKYFSSIAPFFAKESDQESLELILPKLDREKMEQECQKWVLGNTVLEQRIMSLIPDVYASYAEWLVERLPNKLKKAAEFIGLRKNLKTYISEVMSAGDERLLTRLEELEELNKNEGEEFLSKISEAKKWAQLLKNRGNTVIANYDTIRRFGELMYAYKQDFSKLNSIYKSVQRNFEDRFESKPFFAAIEYFPVGNYKNGGVSEDWGVRSPRIYFSNGSVYSEPIKGCEKQVDAAVKYMGS